MIVYVSTIVSNRRIVKGLGKIVVNGKVLHSGAI